ncbi:hypothetical protein GN156_09445 [bacterium LRH843]|nr:hypothetical protein [bacterium LRH843]
MDVRGRIQILFDHNKIDSRHFDLQHLYSEEAAFKQKIQGVKSRNPLLSHEPIFSHNQNKGEADK